MESVSPYLAEPLRSDAVRLITSPRSFT
jgi:hypothetical protein